MKPHEQVKKAGLKSLVELSKLTKVKYHTLLNWHKNKPVLFAIILKGVKND